MAGEPVLTSRVHGDELQLEQGQQGNVQLGRHGVKNQHRIARLEPMVHEQTGGPRCGPV